MENCPEPKPQIVTNGDLADAFLSMRLALRDCNDTKEALRVWAESVNLGNP